MGNPQPQQQPGLGVKIRRFWHWTKVALMVVLIVLLVILILTNLKPPVTVKLLVTEVQGPVAFIVFLSFAAGVGLTLLAMLLRRTRR